ARGSGIARSRRVRAAAGGRPGVARRLCRRLETLIAGGRRVARARLWSGGTRGRRRGARRTCVARAPANGVRGQLGQRSRPRIRPVKRKLLAPAAPRREKLPLTLT